MQNIALIGAGGALGALLRYGLSGLAHLFLGETFPWGTLTVNVVGCFFIGLFWAFSERSPMTPAVRIFLLTGTLGAFTTFSTFGLETFSLLRDGEIALAAGNILAHNVIGLAAVIAGFFLARVALGGGS
jgi:CrcB protein